MYYKNEEDKKRYHRESHKKWRDGLTQDQKIELRKNANKRQREWYKRNSKKSIEVATSRYLKNKEIRKDLLLISKSNGCSKCSEKDPVCLDFHHIDPKDKLFVIGAYQGSLKKIELEIKKCVVLCANCHRKLHHEKRSQ